MLRIVNRRLIRDDSLDTDDFDKEFKRISRIVSIGQFIVFTMVIVIFTCTIFTTVIGYNKIKQDGLKGLVETVWEGSEN